MNGNALLLKAWLRDWHRHPLQRALTILGVVIAVAVVLAVDLANQSAQRAFDRSMLEVAGAATHQILGPAEGFDELYYRDLRLAGWRDLAPVVEGALRLESGETVYLLGVDPLAEAPFREAASGFGSIPVQRLMTEPGTVLVPPEWLQRQGIDGESTLRAHGATGLHRLTALPAPAGAAQGQIWVADIATAQLLLDRAGRLDRIDVRLDRGGRAEDLEAQLPPGLELIAVGARDAAARELAQAFRINLTAMSLLALLIAVFLVYNTQTFSVLRRLQVLGSLHLVGVGRGQVIGVVLFEAFLVGLIGTVLGILFGIWLAQGLVGQVARTVSDHFFTVAVTAVEPRPLALAAVLALGLGLTVLAALAPALEAAGSRGMGASGRAAVERRARNLTGYLFATGLLGLLAGALIAALGLGGLVGGFVALFLMITGFLLLLPRLLVLALRWLGGPIADRFDSPLPRLAGRSLERSLERSLSRSGPAVVALTLALAAAIGVSVLVGSFRVSVADWLGQTLTSDVYLVSAGPAAARSSSRLPGDWADTVRQWAEVASVSTAITLETPSGLGVIDLFLLSPHADWLGHLPLVAGAAPDLDARLRESDAVLITEGFAAHHALNLGDRIEIATPQGRRSFDVAGIYRDYSNPSGTVLMRAERYDPGSAREFASMGLRASEGVTVEALEARLEAWAREQDRPALVTRPEAIEAESLAIFDRTFAITHLLRLITLFVAFVAILSALVALQMERAREYAVLRSTGLPPAGVTQLVFLQGGLLGLYAALAAIPLGLGMGWILIEVINREAFGWRMDVLLPGMPLAENVALGIGAALLASIYPAWRLARMPVVPALRVNA
ncbi:ABC transporter, permease protein [Thioalkalivibrio nitratireducens DSM 14787]|uniref:ABC transporter, permease protein n=1 Tax=Thioalkalivibrio nitratireducens (strain DSM 14787 / UNIQEM 213 / ALEN2) TaxID=1255043 RepID=L0E0C0_THIND|nr:FtsX-like permease family protein [Thioalkalivibrio nitratireducens]AGA34076.1 ABC transporter, permease protein [Thioalkalivibrio nitratireducens DSM 14787]